MKQLTRSYGQLSVSSSNASIIASTYLQSATTQSSSYICPSSKSVKFSINDFSIIDIIKRHELTLPEINKNKIVDDPRLGFHIDKELPVSESIKQIITPNGGGGGMRCLQLYNERKWRSRKMNIKKKKKYEKKLFYVIQKRKQSKQKRYNNIIALYQKIQEKKVELFDVNKYIDRELEKAKFYGFKISPVYDEYRSIVNERMKSFDAKLTRKFDNPKLPLHIKLNVDVKNLK